MTREEAIHRLKNTAWLGTNKDREETEQAVDMAIEALHREEAEEKGYCHRIIPSNVEVVVRCKDCRYKVHCHETVAHTRIHDDFKEHWSEPIEFCSKGERREE